jgi:type I restriction enzyme S subunit
MNPESKYGETAMSMTGRYKPYPANKDSGVEWLGEIPENWKVMRFGFNAKFVVPMRDKPKDLTGDIPWIRIEDFDGARISGSKSGQGISSDIAREMNMKVFPVGTVLCSCSCNMGATAIVDKPLVSNQTFIGIIPGEKLLSEYLYYLLQVAKDHLTVLATGAIQQYLSQNDFSSLRMPLLPKPEQRSIAAFLDRETARIDELVAKKERLIELLREKRAALITRAVIKGLDPSVPMKESGIEWLEEIPAHWDVKRLKNLLKPVKGAIKTGPFGSQLLSSEMANGDVKVYNQRNVLDNDFSSGDNFITLEKFSELFSFEAFPGDLLITTRGSIGKCAIVPDDAKRGILHPCIIRVRLNEKLIIPRFIELLIQESSVVLDQLFYMSNATTIDVIYSDTLKEVYIVVPPLKEQNAIDVYIDRETAQIDKLVEKVREAIKRLKEYRTALISAAVTGKIDVRGEAA